MEKSFEMDYDDWEVIPSTTHPHHHLLDFGLESTKSLMFCEDIDIDYFSNEKNSSSLINISKKEEFTDEELNLKFKDIGVVVSELPEHHDLVSPLVMFKKLKEDEFVDMKVESPKSAATTRNIEPVMFDCKEKEEEEKDFYEDEKNLEKESEFGEGEGEVGGKQERCCWEGLGVKTWRWRVGGGVGALCSLGVAAATIFIFILGGRQQQKQQQNQEIQFQIYSDEKRIKQVMEQATRLNQTFSAARGVPMTRAHISFGGYYDGL